MKIISTPHLNRINNWKPMSHDLHAILIRNRIIPVDWSS